MDVDGDDGRPATATVSIPPEVEALAPYGARFLPLQAGSKQPQHGGHGRTNATELVDFFKLDDQNYGVRLDGWAIVVDVDNPNCDPAKFLMRRLGEHPTWHQRTTKGHHWLFLLPPGIVLRNGNLPDGEGGVYGQILTNAYIVGPGCRIGDRVAYVLEDGRLPILAPDWLVEYAQTAARVAPSSVVGPRRDQIPRGEHDNALASILAQVARSRAGLSQQALYKIADYIANQSGILADSDGYDSSGLARLVASAQAFGDRKPEQDGIGLLPSEWRTGDEVDLAPAPTSWLHGLEGLVPAVGLAIMYGDGKVGKCQKFGTLVRMANGSKRKVEDVLVGEHLLGPDGRPRLVTGLARGRAPMYRVTDRLSGESYTVNDVHPICVVRGVKKRVPGRRSKNAYTFFPKYSTMTAEQILAVPKYGNYIYGYRTKAIPYAHTELKLDPYFLGLWLGDGTTSNSNITNMDSEVKAWLTQFAKNTESTYRERPSKSKASTLILSNKTSLLREIGVLNNKHIPDVYLFSSLEQRLQLLAGLIDTDGYLGKSKTSPGYEITTKLPQLADNIIDLARSLGFGASSKPKALKWHDGRVFVYTRIRIVGDLERIPVRVRHKKFAPKKFRRNWLHYPITIEPVGEDDYAGFELDGDHLYVLGDYTVTHNTSALAWLSAIITQRGQGVIYLASGETTFDEFVRMVALYPNAQPGLVFEYANPGLFTLPSKCAELDKALEEIDGGIAAVLIDAVYSHFEPTSGMHEAARARWCMKPLNEVAQRRGLSILGTIHENAAGGMLGSKEMRNVPRAIIRAIRKPGFPLTIYGAGANVAQVDYGAIFEGEAKPLIGPNGKPLTYRDFMGDEVAQTVWKLKLTGKVKTDGDSITMTLDQAGGADFGAVPDPPKPRGRPRKSPK